MTLPDDSPVQLTDNAVKPQVDADSLTDFLRTYFDGMPGVVVIAHMKPIQKKNGKTLPVPVSEFFTGGDRVKYAVEHVAQVDATEQPKSFYFALETLAAKPEKGRGKARDAFAWRCLRVDIDIKGPGHKTGNVVDDEDAAHKVVADAGLPGPTYWIHSGGGLHGYWFFPPEEISVRGRHWCEGLAKAWAERLKQAGNCDDESSLAAFLRLPGTINRKTEDAKRVEVREGPGRTFTVEELAEYIGYDGPPERTVPAEWSGEIKTGSPCDVIAGFDWGWILEPFGWNLADADTDELVWDRPDGSESGRSAVVYADQPNVLVNYSDASGLPKGAGHKLTKCKVLAKLAYGGRLDSLAGDINDYVTGGEQTKVAEVWEDYPEALDLLRERVTPMGGKTDDDDEHDDETTTEKRQTIVSGWEFTTSNINLEPIWGLDSGDVCLSAKGESTLIVGPPGVGKSTLAHLWMLGRLGLIDRVLGFPIVAGDKKVLYLAMDRPAQIARAMNRLIKPEWESVLTEKLLVHRGPLDAENNPLTHPKALVELAADYGVDSIVVDSLKDVVLAESNEEMAGAWNTARQHALAAGIELLELHHNRKAQGTNKKPNTLDDVYGSRKLTSGAGSVLSLFGEPGDVVVDLSQLKEPSGEFFPRQVLIHKDTGQMDCHDGLDEPVEAALKRAGDRYMTARRVAVQVHNTEKLSKNQLEKVRAKLNRMEKRGEVSTGFSLGLNPEKQYRLKPSGGAE